MKIRKSRKIIAAAITEIVIGTWAVFKYLPPTVTHYGFLAVIVIGVCLLLAASTQEDKEDPYGGY